jgi:hypothetical protein
MRTPFIGDFPVSQYFGLNPEMYKKFNLLGHNGIDFGLPTGTPVISPHKGTVKETAFDPLGYGWYIKIENDVEGSVLAHLELGSIMAKVGDYIDEGQKIGLSDNSGNSTGPHLHWGYYRFPRDRANGFNGFIDQTPYLIAPVDPPPSIPAGDMQSMKQIIIDCYRALCDEEPSQDELNYRLQQKINTYDLIREICSGDERFKKTWLKTGPNTGNVDQTTISAMLTAINEFFKALFAKFLIKK